MKPNWFKLVQFCLDLEKNAFFLVKNAPKGAFLHFLTFWEV